MEPIIIKRIKKTFEDNPDLIIKKINISLFKNIYVLFMETICSSDKVNYYVLNSLSQINIHNINKIKLNDYLAGPNSKNINYDEISFYLTNAFTIVINNDEIVAIETRGELQRNISTPDSQPAINGPKDAFSENYQLNLGLIKRRIKSPSFKIKEQYVGLRTNTKVGIMYFDDIIDHNTLNVVLEKINKIDIDGIIDSGYIKQLLLSEETTTFPRIAASERPDAVVSALLNGKLAILVDTSPFVLILPAFFADFINPVSDNYEKSINITFIKIVRFFCYILSILSPAIYIALINYNQETIPTELLINFATQRDGVPFPALLEAFIMLFLCEVLRESDIRFPSAFGSAISVLGALIIGQAAVAAGIVSPIMIIIIAFSFITSLVFSELEIIDSLRHYRFLFLILAGIYGIYGLILGTIYFLINVTSVKSFNKPYFYPLAPFDFNYLKETLIKTSRQKNKKRSSMLAKNNIKRMD